MRSLSRSPARESISIDALLVRAYRENKIDRLGGATRQVLGIQGPKAPGANTLARGERVDTSTYGASAAARMREVMRMLQNGGDALLTAHDLVLSLDDYFCEDHGTSDLAFSLWTREGALDAGHFIGKSERGEPTFIQAAEVSRDAGPDGETVRVSLIEGAPQRRLERIVIAPLIIASGRADLTPNVSPIEVERVQTVWDRRLKKRVAARTEYVTPLSEIVRERATYAAWHHALTAVASHLADLPGLAVTPPSLSDRPWEVAAVAA